MQKQQFTDGTPITPEWLNAMQNPTFDGSSEDVGHLPLPPNYLEKQQCKTIHVAGASTTVDLGDWPYNAVILAHRRFIGPDSDEHPRNLTVRCSNTTGTIIVIPELDPNGILAVEMVGRGSSERATVEVKNGDIVVMNAYDVDDFIEIRVRKIQTGDNVEFRNVLSRVFAICNDDNKVIFSLDSQNNLVIANAQNSTVPLIWIQLPLKASSIECGTENETGFFKAASDNEKALLKIKDPSRYGGQFLEYSTKTGRFYQGHSYENDIDTIEMTNAMIDLHKEHSGSGFGYDSHILFNKTIDNSLNVVDSIGTICSFNSSGNNFSSQPCKTEITPQGVVSYTYLDGRWVANA